MNNETITKAKSNMNKSIEVYQSNLATVRAGVANASLLDRVMVEYYGVPTPLVQLAGITIPEPRVLMITPYDKTSLNDIEHAILASDLGLTPANDGNVIRLVIPQLTGNGGRKLPRKSASWLKKPRLLSAMSARKP